MLSVNEILNQICSFSLLASVCSQVQILQTVSKGLLELAFALISFVLVTVLYSTLIVPQMHKLKDLRDEIYKKIKIPEELKRDIGAGRSMGDERRLRDEVIAPINEIFEEYEIKEKHLKDFIRLFWITVIILFLLLFMIWLSLWILPVLLVVVFLILHIAITVYAPSSNKVRDIGWLINRAFVNPHTVWETMQLSFAYSNRKPLFSEPKPKDPIHFYLSPGVFYTGYRFLLQITDKNNKKVYYCSFGPVKNDKNILKILFRDERVYYNINMGAMPLGLISGVELKVTIFIFAPAFRTEESTPFVMNHELDKLKKGRIPTGFSTLATLNPDWRDKGISIKGHGSKILKMDVNPSEKNTDVNFKLLSLIKPYLKSTRRIQFYYDTEGKLTKKMSFCLFQVEMLVKSLLPR